MESLVIAVWAGMLGQGAGAGLVTQPDSVEVQSVWDFILKGGPMMIPLAICSLVALAVIVERVMSLRRNQVIPPGFMEGLEAEMKNGTEGHARAIDFCRQNGSAIANILAAGIRKLAKPLEVVEKHIQDAGEREMVRLRKYLRLLSVVAAIAPLMGLLGTIFGMIRAFQTVAIAPEAMGKTGLMAKGIYEAMITTAAGLILAIPVLVCYHWISAKIDRLVFDMDQLTVEFIEEHAPEAAVSDSPAPRLEITDGAEQAVQVAAAAS